MPNLKSFTCSIITEEMQQTYEEIQRNPHLYVNTSFDLIDDDTIEFQTITI